MPWSWYDFVPSTRKLVRMIFVVKSPFFQYGLLSFGSVYISVLWFSWFTVPPLVLWNTMIAETYSSTVWWLLNVSRLKDVLHFMFQLWTLRFRFSHLIIKPVEFHFQINLSVKFLTIHLVNYNQIILQTTLALVIHNDADATKSMGDGSSYL